MSDRRTHEHEPDRAALDELVRAFGRDATSPPVEPPQDRTAVPSESADDDPPQDQLPQDQLPQVQALQDQALRDQALQDQALQDQALRDGSSEDESGGTDDSPVPDVAPPAAPVPPTVIRIDDDGVTFAPGAPARPADPRPSVPAVPTGAPGTEPPIVIAIDDEALPDPVYVEGSLERDGNRSIVFIEDDQSRDTLVPETERDVRRGIEPRMRERRLAVKRAQGRKRLRWVLVAAGVVVLVVGVLAVLGSPLFAIKADQVSVTGNVYTDPVALQAVVDDLVGTPSLLVDTRAAERRLDAIPWVGEAIVRVQFPHAATIQIREREAMTTYQGPDGRFRVLDRDGRVLDVIDNYPFAYVLLGGPDPVDLDAGEFAPRGYAAASELAKNLTSSVRGRVEIIEVTADGSRLTMVLDDGTRVRFGEARDLFAKLVRLETVLAGGPRPVGTIDVSTREVTVPGGSSGQDG